jgi:hypothetical protein
MSSFNFPTVSETVLLLVGFNRIDLLRKRLNEIERNLPVDVYVSIDGPTSTEHGRQILEFLNNYSRTSPLQKLEFRVCEENMGLSRHITSSIDMLFKKYEYVIVLEDDVMISPVFVESMVDGLNIVNQDPILGGVGGFSAFKKMSGWNRKNKWRKSKYFSAWGWATSRTKWSMYHLRIPPDFKTHLNSSKSWNSLSSYQKRLWLSRFKKIDSDRPMTWDYQMQYLYFSTSMRMLLPTQRLSDNEGFSSERSTNTTGKRPRWMLGLGTSRIPPSVSKEYFLWLLEWIDGITIGGDVRVMQFFSETERNILKKIRQLSFRKS